MAHIVRAYNQFLDRFGQTWRISICEEGYEGLMSRFIAGAVPLSFRFGPGGDIQSVIKDTECTVEVKQRQDEDFSWLLTDDDRKIKVIIHKYEEANPPNLWYTNSDYIWYQGYMLTGQFIDDLSYVRSFSVTFSDQLRLISSQLFTVSGTNEPTDSSGNLYTGRETILQQLIQALEKTDLGLNLNIACNLFETTINQTDADDPFAQIDVWQDLWFDQDFKPGDCVTVIEELLKVFNCRIFQAEGEWWICRVPELTNPSIKYRKFSSLGVYISNDVLEAHIITSTSLQKFSPSFQRAGGQLNYIHEWKYRDVELDYGLRNSIVVSMILDNMSLQTSLNELWTNAGSIFNIGTTWEPTTVYADTSGRNSLDITKYLSSPETNIYAASKYVFSMACGRSKAAGTCVVKLLLTVGTTDYAYDDSRAEGDKWALAGLVVATGFNFKKTNDPRVLETQTINVESPPGDGVLRIVIYAPYRSLFEGNVTFYMRDVSFTIYADPEVDVTNGRVYNGIINPNAFTIPEAVRLRISDAVEAVTGLYLGGTLIHGENTPTALWEQRDAVGSAQLSLFNWYVLNQWEQHYTANRSYDGSFIGAAAMYNVLVLTEFSDAFFILDDVEYSVKEGIWSGVFIELIESSLSWEIITAPTLKSNTLPTEGGGTTIISGGIATNPGGNDYELQINGEGEFAGSTGITFDATNSRLKKGELPLIAYTKQTETVSAGATWIAFPVGTFVDGDDVGMDSVISGVTTDSNDPEILWAVPYGITYEGFYINFIREVTFTYDAFIKR